MGPESGKYVWSYSKQQGANLGKMSAKNKHNRKKKLEQIVKKKWI